MKSKLVFSALAAFGLATSALTASLAAAQPAEGEREVAAPAGAAGPGSLGNRMLTRRMDLSEPQRAEMRELQRNHLSQTAPLRRQLADYRSAFNELVASGVFDGPARDYAYAMGELSAELTLLDAQHQSQVQALLSDEQRAGLERQRRALRAWADSAPRTRRFRRGQGSE